MHPIVSSSCWTDLLCTVTCICHLVLCKTLPTSICRYPLWRPNQHHTLCNKVPTQCRQSIISWSLQDCRTAATSGASWTSSSPQPGSLCWISWQRLLTSWQGAAGPDPASACTWSALVRHIYHMYIYTYICTYIHTYIHTYISIHTHIYIYIFRHPKMDRRQDGLHIAAALLTSHCCQSTTLLPINLSVLSCFTQSEGHTCLVKLASKSCSINQTPAYQSCLGLQFFLYVAWRGGNQVN